MKACKKQHRLKSASHLTEELELRIQAGFLYFLQQISACRLEERRDLQMIDKPLRTTTRPNLDGTTAACHKPSAICPVSPHALGLRTSCRKNSSSSQPAFYHILLSLFREDN